jgi:hypothetical protein
VTYRLDDRWHLGADPEDREIGPEVSIERTDDWWRILGRPATRVTVRCACGTCSLEGLLDAPPKRGDVDSLVAHLRRSLRREHVCERPEEATR